MQLVPIYVLSANGERSPVNDHPFCLFNPQEDAQILEKEYGIPRRYLGTIMSPWAAKRLHEFGGDITKFRVVKVWPSILQQIAIAKTEPGDENNQDISALVGKVDIRKLEHYAQNDSRQGSHRLVKISTKLEIGQNSATAPQYSSCHSRPRPLRGR